MGTKIEDGTGNGYEAKVNVSNELSVIPGSPLERARARGDAFSWFVTSVDIDTGDTLFIVRNDSSLKDLVIESVTIYNGNVAATTYDFHVVTAGYTAAGTASVGTNLNSNFANGGACTAKSDETGNAQGTVIEEYITVTASVTYGPLPVGVRLGTGHAFGVDQITESTAGGVRVIGYFVDRE